MERWPGDDWKPAVDPTGNNRTYWVRECHGRDGSLHYHITCGLGDLMVLGDPFKNRKDAELACAAMNRNNALPDEEG